jgi:DNA-binding GntR family transcriptional regulator
LTPLEEESIGALLDEIDRLNANASTHAMELLKLNRALEMAIVGASGNERLAATFELVLDGAERIRRLAMRLNPSPENWVHPRKIVDAIKRRDPEAARAAIIERITNSEQQLINALLSSSAFESLNVGIPSSDT